MTRALTRGRAGGRVASLAGRVGVAAGAIALAVSPVAAQDRSLPDTLTLEAAVRLAIENSPELRRAGAVADAAAAGRRADFGAFLPTADANMSFSRVDFTTFTFPAPEGTSQRLDEPVRDVSKGAGQGISLGLTVLEGGRRFAALREGAASVRAAQRRLDAASRQVVADVKKAYYEALKQQRSAQVAVTQRDDRREELELTRRRYEIAAVSRADLVGAEMNLVDAELQLLTARQQEGAAHRSLRVTLGLSAEQAPEDPLPVLEDVAAAPAADGLEAERLVGVALGDSPEIRALNAEREAGSAALWASRASYLPTIQLGYNYNRSERLGPEDPFFVFDPSNRSSTFSVTASWSLFDGFRREESTAQASSSLRQKRAEIATRTLEIQRDVRNLADDLVRRDESLALRQRSYDLARERLEMTREQYRLGTLDFTALQQAVDAVTRAESFLIEDRYEYLKAWADLEALVGDVR